MSVISAPIGGEELKERRRPTQSDPAAAQQAAQQLVANRLPRYFAPIYQADSAARMRSAIATDRPFVERLVHFWSNHFAVSVDKVAVLGLAGCMEREAIRPNILGNFSDLLLSVEKHPAMLMFLDNQLSIGPGFDAGRPGRTAATAAQLGLNENLAREILELHTLGVDGGYSQADVTSFAKVITGWSIGGLPNQPARLRDNAAPGQFVFRPGVHEPGTQTVVGRRYAQEGVAQGEAVLRDLAACAADREAPRHQAGAALHRRRAARGGRRATDPGLPEERRSPADGVCRADRFARGLGH